MYPANGWQYLPLAPERRKKKIVDPALSIKGSGLFSFQTRSPCTPATATTYGKSNDVCLRSCLHAPCVVL